MLKKIKSKLLKSGNNTQKRGGDMMLDEDEIRTPNENLHLLEEYGQIKSNPMQITGPDFDRAFAFLEKYPDTMQAERLIEEMYKVGGDKLKGLSYESAVNILTKMPDHPGAKSVIFGMYKIEKDYIKKLVSDVLIFMLEIAPEHPHAEELTTAIVNKNFTNAYNFITRNPGHIHTRQMIREMFKQDPNIAILLLQEQMDHPKVDSIIEGVYDLTPFDIRKLTPNAIIFVLDVAPDHQYAEKLVNRLVEENYIKAYEFIKEHMEYPNAEMMVNAICKRKPELKSLFD